jgi:erythromycin esterase-like protein
LLGREPEQTGEGVTTALSLSAGNNAEAVVWAHNSHIRNAAATAMDCQGEFNIGELCRTAYGDDAALIGFGTDRGTVAAADDWGGEMRVQTVIPVRPDSYGHAFHQTLRPEWKKHDRVIVAVIRYAVAVGSNG